ncbi:SIR2 family protein [Desulfovibrio sp.]|uniref:SIR2 family protein n=1 Tax=Desulfovibrio sp. TaxID=885 RepID=UPI0025C0E6AF|nr:SIR2 family protein [Desulfovibrio sp.]
MKAWGTHVYRIGNEENLDVQTPEESKKIELQKKQIEPWLAAVFQSEHLALLLGSGFTKAVAYQAGTTAADMACDYSDFPLADKLKDAAQSAAKTMGRGEANIEDQIRAANALAQGLKILGDKSHVAVTSALDSLFKKFLNGISTTERNIKTAIEKDVASEPVTTSPGGDRAVENDDSEKLDSLVMLVSFLLSFSSRTATRERLHIFTTNYDRLIEYGADLAGLHLLDRFVGCLEPIFRSSRLDIDMHYNPPGIRGEPRYLEGVVRLTKLHGSLDWVYRKGFVRKVGIPFGPQEGHPAIDDQPNSSVMIYPNAAKDRETSEYPYVELFRDYAAAVCRPNSVLVTYGYGFGDEHINRTIADMLTIPSTHLVIISFGDEGGRISSFCKQVGRKAQISLLIGPHFGDMPTLVENYLPKPAIDRITIRQTDLLRNRGWETTSHRGGEEES